MILSANSKQYRTCRWTMVPGLDVNTGFVGFGRKGQPHRRSLEGLSGSGFVHACGPMPVSGKFRTTTFPGTSSAIAQSTPCSSAPRQIGRRLNDSFPGRRDKGGAQEMRRRVVPPPADVNCLHVEFCSFRNCCFCEICKL